MRVTEVDYESVWEEDELMGIKKCPICKHDYSKTDEEFMVVSIYNGEPDIVGMDVINPESCDNCGAKFYIQQIKTKMFVIEE